MLSPRPKFLLSVITIAAAGSSCTFESTTPGINANAAVSGSAYSPPPVVLLLERILVLYSQFQRHLNSL